MCIMGKKTLNFMNNKEIVSTSFSYSIFEETHDCYCYENTFSNVNRTAFISDLVFGYH